MLFHDEGYITYKVLYPG